MDKHSFKQINDSMTPREMLDIICDNNRIAHYVKGEINRLCRKESDSSEVFVDTVISEPIEDEDNTIQVVDDIEFRELLQKYWEEYKKIDLDNFDKIKEILPDEYQYRYKDILRGLIAKSQQELRIIKDILKEEGQDEYLLSQLELENKKIAYLRELLLEGQLEEVVDNNNYGEPNEIILVPNDNGKIQVLDELEGIDPNNYYRIFELFYSIITGQFKRMKRFTSTDASLSGYSEVKGYQVRVFFKQIDTHKYAIISVFVKKADNAKGYRNYLHNVAAMYRRVDSKGILRMPEFLEGNNSSIQELWNILSRNSDVSEKIDTDEDVKKLIKGGV